MPYNKGDFTQQGVNGDVSALVRLNEKRVMKVVLSSDDESDNCDISGKVYDLLNGTSYDVGSGVSGNIEITENGENINVAPYATATVNVSGGGTEFPKCTATIINNDVADDTFFSLYNGVIQQITVPANSSITIELPYLFDDEEEIYVVYSYRTARRAENLSTLVSNMVNMTTTPWGLDTVALEITDHTADSSVTLDIKFLQDR